MKDRQRYAFGYNDVRGYLNPHYKPEPFNKPIKVSWRLKAAYIGLFISGSMALAPMAWVKLFQWLFT